MFQPEFNSALDVEMVSITSDRHWQHNQKLIAKGLQHGRASSIRDEKGSKVKIAKEREQWDFNDNGWNFSMDEAIEPLRLKAGGQAIHNFDSSE